MAGFPGKGNSMTIHIASEAPFRNFDVIPTGMQKLDAAIGIGGIPTRYITEIYGPYSVGKTTLALTVVTQAQKIGMKCLWADIEFAWDEGYAAKLGVDLTKLGLIREVVAEDAIDDILSFAANNENSLIVVDAVGALHPRAEAEKTSDQKTIGTQAKLVSTFCRRIVPLLAIYNNALLLLNHSFKDVMSGANKTSGGQKLEYHKSLSISLKPAYGREVTRASDGAKVGIVIEAEIMKNKKASTVGTKVELMMIPGQGFSKEADLLDDLIASGEVHLKGKTYYRGLTKMGVGVRAARAWLKEHEAGETA